MYKFQINKRLEKFNLTANADDVEEVMRIMHNGILDNLFPEEFDDSVKVAVMVLTTLHHQDTFSHADTKKN